MKAGTSWSKREEQQLFLLSSLLIPVTLSLSLSLSLSEREWVTLSLISFLIPTFTWRANLTLDLQVIDSPTSFLLLYLSSILSLPNRFLSLTIHSLSLSSYLSGLSSFLLLLTYTVHFFLPFLSLSLSNFVLLIVFEQVTHGNRHTTQQSIHNTTTGSTITIVPELLPEEEKKRKKELNKWDGERDEEKWKGRGR